MSISIAEYLVNQAVKTASGLKQHAKNSNNQAALKLQRERVSSRLAEVKRASSPSSAYRVTISSAAMQKMATSGLAR